MTICLIELSIMALILMFYLIFKKLFFQKSERGKRIKNAFIAFIAFSFVF